MIEQNSEKKIYFKVYQDVNNIEGESYITTPEEFMTNLSDVIKDCYLDDDETLLPVVEMVMMTEEEVSNLPEFQGY